MESWQTMKSILQDKKECFITGCTTGLHCHHIFEGTGRRKLSEQYGLKVWLIPELHNMSNKGVHFNKDLDLTIKRAGQIAFESKWGTREDFIKLFGRNYLD